jgi:DNA polymerase I-like protein with 3'-5' exonuclease and polymerase domains
VERDYSQGELRVVACIANETNMIAAYKAGRDLHIETAAPFAGFTYDTLVALEQTAPHQFEETRQLGKAGNFGLVFGMMEDGFVAYARRTYNIELTREQAHEFRESFFHRYPRLLVYHEQYKRHARDHKFVRTPLGRIRHLPLIRSPNREVAAKAERQAINSPVQGTLTDMGLWTIALEHQSGLSAIAPCFGACHDSILNYVPEDLVDEIVTRQLEQMESLPFDKVGWQPQLKFVADAKVGTNWGALQKFQRSS